MKKVIVLENGRKKVISYNYEPTKTQQQFKEQCDVNNIMKKFANTGELHHLNRKNGAYLDLTQIPSYQEALGTIIQANDSFMSLPSAIRKRFGNDPSQMIEFLNNKDNYDESIKLGLREKIIPPVDKMDTLISEVQKQNKNKTDDAKTKSKTIDKN